jgi:hypothetical protein
VKGREKVHMYIYNKVSKGESEGDDDVDVDEM